MKLFFSSTIAGFILLFQAIPGTDGIYRVWIRIIQPNALVFFPIGTYTPCCLYAWVTDKLGIAFIAVVHNPIDDISPKA